MDSQTEALQNYRQSHFPSLVEFRGARKSDWEAIEALYKAYDFTLDTSHLERMLVIEYNGKVIAAGALVKLLEAAFVVDETLPRKLRLEALTVLLARASHECLAIGYNNYHVFATRDSIYRLLTKKFNFVASVGKSLIHWVTGAENGQGR